MKIAVTTAGDSVKARLDKRFGRAEKFLIIDKESGGVSVVDNTQNLNAAQGAGIQAAQNVAATGATVLITGHCGPKAFQVLNAAGIKIFPAEADTVEEALQLYDSGSLQAAESADVEGHWM